MSIVAMIPARSGSKRVLNKNLIDFCGKPLLYWTAVAAMKSKYIDHVIVSTDSKEIQSIANAIGVETPFLRPKEISTSSAGMIEVMQHSLKWFESCHDSVEAFILLQPTSPLRTFSHIDEAIELFRSSKESSLVSVTEVPHIYHPDIVHDMDDNNLLSPYCSDKLKNQQEPSDNVVYARNGPAILINKPDVIRKGKKFEDPLIAYVMENKNSIDIDEYEDLCVAEFIMKSS